MPVGGCLNAANKLGFQTGATDQAPETHRTIAHFRHETNPSTPADRGWTTTRQDNYRQTPNHPRAPDVKKMMYCERTTPHGAPAY